MWLRRIDQGRLNRSLSIISLLYVPMQNGTYHLGRQNPDLNHHQLLLQDDFESRVLKVQSFPQTPILSAERIQPYLLRVLKDRAKLAC